LQLLPIQPKEPGLPKQRFLIPTRLVDDGKNALRGFEIREGGEDAARRAE